MVRIAGIVVILAAVGVLFDRYLMLFDPLGGTHGRTNR